MTIAIRSKHPGNGWRPIPFPIFLAIVIMVITVVEIGKTIARPTQDTPAIVVYHASSGEVTVKSRVRPEGAASEAETVTFAEVTITEGVKSCKASGNMNYAEPGWQQSKSWRTDVEVGVPCSPEEIESLLKKLERLFDLEENGAKDLFNETMRNIRFHYVIK